MTRTRHSTPTFQLRLVADKDVVIGPGKADLLEAIDRSGSIASASRELGMSYKKAWQLIETMNRHFATPLIDTRMGGSQHGGATLTPLGREVIDHYRALERRLAPDDCPEARALLECLAPSE
ncbi:MULTISPECIES: winged helix-turn-helix domain-containing protein [unclassified Modicisalibacter]|uniref:winged helix-turn-helix domain-containing protein n=1 Tax=unclassified Modicisalibacter TaxID=2679913 RepID=UPI001CCD1E4A|nr:MULTISPECIES: winged helix-turn-helix domain-containing protein [unclassified Modicisalibacter]MBZ9560153.1 winged helix-turn-helix domain-containing protein [Modicisalibacter sp. R2A 31.J]MBZ9576061.1 winged helix-turn-helix domain-containing protein [Modicisalibacter sp. MOD 31.J]